MRTSKYRLTALRLTPDGPGARYELHILANGRGRAARGRVAVLADLQESVNATIQDTYFILTGEKLEDADMH